MKWLVTIFSFYLVALLIAPCSDAENNCDNLAGIPLSGQLKDHAHNQDKDDLCSPFCNCVCCSVNVRSIDFTITRIHTPVLPFIALNDILSDSALVSNYYGNIWQPPRFNA
ncbi:DUF6660 family protein [Gynurincola endophyticus]|uniref:DUF6660 family protein n=1 Tax=Gynurincola endophyticus TaxID=2479004 RepID=UPI000F8F0265|nr:DUF6660 family protein [Gynurincola endophyticus]